jgi:AcrR family transcriptional regulator
MGKPEILSQSLRLFLEKGYDGASMSDIAYAVGIQKASLYAHFTGKEEIFSAVFSDVLEEYRRLLSSFAARQAGENALSQLEQIFRAFLLYCHQSTKMSFWDRFFYYPPEFIRERMASETGKTQQEFLRMLERVLAEGMERGEIRRQPVEGAALAYYYLMIGLSMSVSLYARDALEHDIALAWGGLARGLEPNNKLGESV